MMAMDGHFTRPEDESFPDWARRWGDRFVDDNEGPDPQDMGPAFSFQEGYRPDPEDDPRPGTGGTGGTKTKMSRFVPMSWADLEAAPRAPYLVKGFLDKGALGLIYGPSNSGKTFAALDMALAVARGADWMGSKTRQGRVVYVAAEAGMSIGRRLAAYRLHHKVTPTDALQVIPVAPDLLDSGQVADLIAAIGKADLVILDTLARSFSGDENSAAEVGRAVLACDRIRADTGAAVLIVHHSGKDDAKGARGSSALRAAVDVEMSVNNENGHVTIETKKARDGSLDPTKTFKLEPVEIGRDEDGDPVTSCVVTGTDKTDMSGKRPRLSAANQIAHRVLWDEIACHGAVPPPNEHIPPNTPAITIDAWKERLRATYVGDGGKTAEAARQAIKRASETLLLGGYIGIHTPWVWGVPSKKSNQ